MSAKVGLAWNRLNRQRGQMLCVMSDPKPSRLRVLLSLSPGGQGLPYGQLVGIKSFDGPEIPLNRLHNFADPSSWST